MSTINLKFDPNAYGITVRRAIVDDELLFVATVAELPSVKAIGETYSEAYEFVIDAIATLHNTSNKMGHPFPEPSVLSSEHSGRVTLRMPPWLHAQLELEATSDAMSLNQTIVTLLASRTATKAVANETTSAIETLISRLMQKGAEVEAKTQEATISSYSSSWSRNFKEMENDQWKSLH